MKVSKLNIVTFASRPRLISPVNIFLIIVIVSTINIKYTESIVLPPEFDKYLEDDGNKDLLVPEIEEYVRLQELSRMIPCLIRFIEAYLNVQPSRIPVVLPDNVDNYLEISRVFLTELQRIRSTFVLSGHLDPTADHITSLSGLIIVKNSLELLNSKTQYINLCGRDCKYLVALTSTFSNEETFLEESNNLVQCLWDRRVANVVFLGVVGHTVLISRSLSFKADEATTPSNPVVIAECDEDLNWTDSKWSAVTQFYSPLNLNRSIIHVAFFDYPPYVGSVKIDSESPSPMTEWRRNDTLGIDNETSLAIGNNITSKLMGVEGLIINTLASSLNFLVSPLEIEWKYGESVAEEVNSALWGIAEIDIVLGCLPWAPEKETDYTLPYEVVQYVWLLPILPNISLEGLIAPLDTNVWLAIVAVLVFAFTIEFVVKRNISFLQTLSLIIGVAWYRQPTILSTRMRFMSWVIFGYILTQFYLASLAGQLVASSGVQIETLEELLDSGFKLGASSNMETLFHQPHETETDEQHHVDAHLNEINDILREKVELFEHEEYVKHFDELIEGENVDFALAVLMNISSMIPSYAGKQVHRMKESLASYPLSFAVWRGMPYLSEFDKKISYLIEGGIILHWARTVSLLHRGYYNTQVEKTKGDLSLDTLVPGFLLLIMGYGFAGIFFFIEIAVFHWKKRRTKQSPRKKLKNDINKKKSMLRPPGVSLAKGMKAGKMLEPFDAKTLNAMFNNRHKHQMQNNRSITRKAYFDFVL